jgi:hypothetical protein
MLQDLEAAGDKQREEISGRAHRFDSSSRRVNLNQRIKSLSRRGSGRFVVVHVTGQAVYAYPREPGGLPAPQHAWSGTVRPWMSTGFHPQAMAIITHLVTQ